MIHIQMVLRKFIVKGLPIVFFLLPTLIVVYKVTSGSASKTSSRTGPLVCGS